MSDNRRHQSIPCGPTSYFHVKKAQPRFAGLQGRRRGVGVITWGSATGCGEQRESSSNPLHSNPQSVLQQSWNSNSDAKQSTGIENPMLVLQQFTLSRGTVARGREKNTQRINEVHFTTCPAKHYFNNWKSAKERKKQPAGRH